jgi:hypothetical protein
MLNKHPTRNGLLFLNLAGAHNGTPPADFQYDMIPLYKKPSGLSSRIVLLVFIAILDLFITLSAGSAGLSVTSAECSLLTESWIVRRSNTQEIPTVRSLFGDIPRSGTIYRPWCGKDTSQKHPSRQ